MTNTLAGQQHHDEPSKEQKNISTIQRVQGANDHVMTFTPAVENAAFATFKAEHDPGFDETVFFKKCVETHPSVVWLEKEGKNLKHYYAKLHRCPGYHQYVILTVNPHDGQGVDPDFIALRMLNLTAYEPPDHPIFYVPSDNLGGMIARATCFHCNDEKLWVLSWVRDVRRDFPPVIANMFVKHFFKGVKIIGPLE